MNDATVQQRVCARNHPLRMTLRRMTVPPENKDGYGHSLAMNTGICELWTVDEVPQVLGEGDGGGQCWRKQEGAAMAALVDTCHRHLHADCDREPFNNRL